MSDLRCRHCGIRHDERLVICPATGLAIAPGPGGQVRASSVPAPRGLIPPSPGIPRMIGQPAARVPATAVPGGVAPASAAAAARAPEPAPSTRKPERRDLVGRVIGDKYALKALIGEGGMGAVYEAEHVAIGKTVAVKVLHPKHAQQPESVARLRHEARVAGTIGHPSICEIFDLGRLDDGTPYLVMERLVGETLDERIKREGALPERDIVDIMLQVLGGLAAAHGKGIIHRDLKPENIFLVRRQGAPTLAKLLDFGISKAVDADEADADLTRPGIVMGTPYYMAPEQARGDRALDHRVDLWAAGVILYEALSGRRPFVARNYNALLVQILTSKHRPLSEVRPGITRGLERVADKALSKMREDRFQTAVEFSDALRRALEPEPPPRARPKPTNAMQFQDEPTEDETMVLALSHAELAMLGGPRSRPRPAAGAPASSSAASSSGPPSSRVGPPPSSRAPATIPMGQPPAPAVAAHPPPMAPPPIPPSPPSATPPTLPGAHVAGHAPAPPPSAPLPPPPPAPPYPAAYPPGPAYGARGPLPAMPLPPPAPPRPQAVAAPPPVAAAPAAADEEERTLVDALDPLDFTDERPTLVRMPSPPEGGT
jgi:serine/threonine-protein kinase